MVGSYDYSAFGEERFSQGRVSTSWRYAAKRLDKETGLIYFGKRYLDPQLGRWMSQDPAGFQDSTNLYQYLLNNPFRYVDPNGENLFGFLLGIGEMVLGGALMATGVALEVATFGGYTFAFGFHETATLALMAHGCAYATVQSRDVAFPNRMAKDIAVAQPQPNVKEKPQKHNTNPFDGPVDEGVNIVDSEGNVIPVKKGNWATGSKDEKWIQEMKPGQKPKGEPTGLRKDGDGHPLSSSHKDPRSLNPHAHVPNVTNPDGTPWLPIN